MFICNVKLDSNKIFKVFIFVIAIVVALLFVFICFKIFNESKSEKSEYSLPNPAVADISTENYTNVLKAVHDDLNTYVGQRIHFSGYVYRAIDFKDNEFVLARDMIISSNQQTLIVGFLCQSDKVSSIPDNTWVEITGTIKKGIYHSEIPIIYVSELKQIEKPSDEFVYPPDDTYVPTSVLM